MLVLFFPFLVVFTLAFYLFLVESIPSYVPFLLIVASFIAVLFALLVQHCISSVALHIASNDTFAQMIFNSFLYSATIEEISKIFFFFTTYKLLHLRQQAKEKTNSTSIRTISRLAMLFASSFAAFETVSYSIYEPQLLFIRLFSASLLHILVAPIYVGIFKKQMLLSIFASISIHGIYNLLVEASSVTFPFSFLVLIPLLLKASYDLRHT